MPDRKRNSSTSSFDETVKQFLRYAGIFFAPVLLVAVVLELLVVDLPSPYKIVGEYIDTQAQDIEVVVFGSSQIKNSVNPQFLDKNTLNISSSAQHHNTDFKLLQGLIDRLPKLETVVFEVSYGHFEVPHNSKYYWKNATFLKYYDINTFGRAVSPTDRLLYISHPGYFSTQLVDYYIRDSLPYEYNEWGFDQNNYKGKFKKLGFDEQAIDSSFVMVNRRESISSLDHNVEYFEEMLQFSKENGLKIVLISPPTFRNYVRKRDPNILRRRDSTIEALKQRHSNLRFLNTETNSRFEVTDFRNENHLNPVGAKKFTLMLNRLLNDS